MRKARAKLLSTTLTVALVVVLGLLTAVGVAWSCQLYSPVAAAGSYGLRDSGMYVMHERGYGREVFMQTKLERGWPSDAAVVPSIDHVPVPLGARGAELACSPSFVRWQLAGLPMRCLQMKAVTGNAAYTPGAYENGIFLMRTRQGAASGLYGGDGRVPVRPVWLGLVADTLLWSAPWVLLVAIVRRSRRLLREWTGRCPDCNYDLSETAAGVPCPECGAARPLPGPAAARPTLVPAGSPRAKEDHP